MDENDRTVRRSVHPHKADMPEQIKSLRASEHGRMREGHIAQMSVRGSNSLAIFVKREIRL